ncbi:hypothetical protein DFJ58DRAFT_768974 [Suillus subalutaceus]|uniref:uncharacterized protein n=1 Tax=Suillus subalutaceus TaxID=48586 RepID=UPI001B86AD87|nr:uncharacterized protein DFJ58DRAFT_768974 [Suillus subalutaceus]KAG1867221.1 hypothetical protein DFJ58DRAFT_768974 [Suillus subalutaceus]
MLSLGQRRIAVSACAHMLCLRSFATSATSSSNAGNAITRQISEISQDVEDASKAASPQLTSSSCHGAQNTPGTIAGFVIPEEPIPPSDEECCMSGCAICVYDLYEESLETYKESIVALRSSLSALSIPNSEWPDRVRANTPAAEKRHEVIFNAFEEMERQLKEKKERRAAVEVES